jgi:hypothetical protein
VDDYKRRAAARLLAAEKELDALRVQTKLTQERTAAARKEMAAEIAQLRLKQASDAQEAGQKQADLARQLAEVSRARAAVAADLEQAQARIAALQKAAAAAAAAAAAPSQSRLAPPAPNSTSSTPSSSPSGSSISTISTISTTSPRRERDGRELKKSKSERRLRAETSPGDAVAALGRGALLTQSAGVQTQAKSPELQRQRTELLRSEAAKRADQDAKDTDSVKELRRRDERRLREGVNAILKGEEIDLRSIKRLYSICSSDVGRRAFIQTLKKTMKETKNLVLPSTSFEVLVYLYNYNISAMETAHRCVGFSLFFRHIDRSSRVDFRACMIFMYTAQALCRKTPEGPTEYLAEHIKSHTVWRDLTFWVECVENRKGLFYLF